MDPETGKFHRIVADEDLRARADDVTARQAAGWVKFAIGETVVVKGVPMRVAGITKHRLILQPVQQIKPGDTLKKGLPTNRKS